MEKIFTLAELSNGDVAVKNDGREDELRQVLKFCFPTDITSDGGLIHKEYYKAPGNYWGCNNHKLPTQSVKDFLKQLPGEEEEFKNGEWLEVSNDEKNWHPSWFVGINPDRVRKNKFVTTSNGNNFCAHAFCRRPIPKTKVTLSEAKRIVAKEMGVEESNLIIE
jgi:hypothetical protein